MRLALLYKAIVANEKSKPCHGALESASKEVAGWMTANPTASLSSSTTHSLQGGWKWASITQLHLVSGKQITPQNPPCLLNITRFLFLQGERVLRSGWQMVVLGQAQMPTYGWAWPKSVCPNQLSFCAEELLCGSGLLLWSVNAGILIKYFQGEQS